MRVERKWVKVRIAFSFWKKRFSDFVDFLQRTFIIVTHFFLQFFNVKSVKLFLWLMLFLLFINLLLNKFDSLFLGLDVLIDELILVFDLLNFWGIGLISAFLRVARHTFVQLHILKQVLSKIFASFRTFLLTDIVEFLRRHGSHFFPLLFSIFIAIFLFLNLFLGRFHLKRPQLILNVVFGVWWWLQVMVFCVIFVETIFGSLLGFFLDKFIDLLKLGIFGCGEWVLEEELVVGRFGFGDFWLENQRVWHCFMNIVIL